MENNNQKQVTFEDIENNEEINEYITKGNEYLGVMNYTEHGFAHLKRSAVYARRILEDLGYDERTCELAAIAGYMHDIGNSVNRNDHAHSGSILAYEILKDLGMPLKDAITIMCAIGNHDEKTGTAVDVVSAALILADKTDVRRNRVRNRVIASFDAHDRVNYAALSAKLSVIPEKKIIQMDLELDDTMSSVMDYFEIFLERMMMCRKAAEVFGYKFKLVSNGSKLS